MFTISRGHVSEINDFGYPQNSEIDTLKSYITTESVMSSPHVAVRSFPYLLCVRVHIRLQEESAKITVQATGATSWRRGDVKYKKNEAFVDVVETVNLSMSAKGKLLPVTSDVAFPHCQRRNHTPSRCRWPHTNAGLFVRHARVQIWSQ